ncbi:hypothetical protein BDZ89DRAFT_1143429 [Hymenopellis radicata]|nr:hypothetical protein BDZ89DRAFT_1143429 [Hymenopellis radicata]
MPLPYRWNHPHGIKTLQEIVKKKIPTWKDGLREAQLEFIPPILDNTNVLCIETTGGGKSAAFSVPIIVHNEVSANPSLYPRFSCRKYAVGIVITPTNGLAGDIVNELEAMGISALAYTSAHWRVTIPRSSVFRENLIYSCAEEAHLLYEWGLEFRKAFGNVGVYFRGVLPSSISVFALTATLPPGEQTQHVCKNLGFTRGNYTLIRRSNERENIQLNFAPLRNALSGKEFPQLFDYFAPGHKTIIHCSTIDQVLQVFTYLWKMSPPGSNFLRRVRMYHSLCSDAYNAETLRLLDADPWCQIVIGTVAFANGINARTLTLAILLSFPDTVNEMLQRIGRIGRINSAQKQLSAPPETSSALVAKASSKTSKKKATRPIEASKARVITVKDTDCLIATINREYNNPPLETAFLDCCAAKRRYYCSNCSTRFNITYDFPPPAHPANTELPPPFLTPIAKPKKRTADKISKEQRAIITSRLQAFGSKIWQENHEQDQYRHLPRSVFFPPSVSKLVISHIRSIKTTAELLTLIGPFSWRFDLIYWRKKQRTRTKDAGLAKSKGKKRKVNEWDTDSDELEPEDFDGTSSGNNDEDVPMSPSPRLSEAPSSPRRPPPKRQTLENITNTLPIPNTAQRPNAHNLQSC